MSEHAWITRAPSDERLMARIWSDAEIDDDQAVREVERPVKNKSSRGVPLPASDFPTRMAGQRDPSDPPKIYKKLPHFTTSGWMLVSKELADVIRQFDLGGGLYPVDVYQEDRKTPVPGTYFHLNIGAAKAALLPDQSPGVRLRRGSRTLSIKGALKDDDITLSDVVLSGPDIWVDPKLTSAIFFSDRLWKALKAAKVHTPFRAKRCVVIAE